MAKKEKIHPGGDEEEPEQPEQPEQPEVLTDEEKAQLADWRAAFAVFDKDGNGTIEFGELKEVIDKEYKNINVETLKAIFNSVDVDESGAIDFEEFSGMMKNADDQKDGASSISMMNQVQKIDSDFFTKVAKKEALKAKKLRLNKYSTMSEEALAEKEATRAKAAKEAKVAAAIISKKAYEPVFLGERQKLLWRTNTRLDIMIYLSNDEVLIVQTSSKQPTVIYPLVYLNYKAVNEFVETQNTGGSDQKGKSQTEAEIASKQKESICNYVVARMQLGDATLAASQSAPVAGAASAATTSQKVVTVTKLSADTANEIQMQVDPAMYPVPTLEIVESLTSEQWDAKMDGIAADIKRATDDRLASNKNLNVMGFTLDTLENLLNSVRFQNRRRLGKWARAVLHLRDTNELEATLKRLESLKMK